MSQLQWDLRFWENNSGRSPVADEFDKLGKKDPSFHHEIRMAIREMTMKYNIPYLFRGGDIEKVENTKDLIELKIHLKQEYRFLGILEYPIDQNEIPRFVALHNFVKKRQKLKNSDIRLSLGRIKEYKKEKGQK